MNQLFNTRILTAQEKIAMTAGALRLSDLSWNRQWRLTHSGVGGAPLQGEDYAFEPDEHRVQLSDEAYDAALRTYAQALGAEMLVGEMADDAAAILVQLPPAEA